MSLFKQVDHNFAKVIFDASLTCENETTEEQGGIILEKNGEYKFQHIKNLHAGTPTAHGLYEVPSDGMKDVSALVMDGWRIYASFHTHPAFSARPSNLDTSQLFRGFKYNVIISLHTGMFSISEWIDGDFDMSLVTMYIPRSCVLEYAGDYKLAKLGIN